MVKSFPQLCFFDRPDVRLLTEYAFRHILQAGMRSLKRNFGKELVLSLYCFKFVMLA